MQKRNINLRVVRDDTDQLDKQTKNSLQKDTMVISGFHKRKSRKRIVIGGVAIIVALAALFLVIFLQTYTKVRVTDTYKIGNAADNNYEELLPEFQESEKYMSYKDTQKIKKTLEEKYINTFKEDSWIKKEFIESILKDEDPLKNIKKKDDMER